MEEESRSSEGVLDSLRAPAAPPPEVSRSGWLGWSVVAGCVLGVPAGVLLAYLSALPFLLGLFFYLLLGLIVGATMFRFGRRAPAPSKRVAFWMGLAVGVFVWGTSLYAEYLALPRSADKQVRDSFRGTFSPQQREQLRQGTRDFVAKFLRDHHPPGGFIGYLRWAAKDGTMECPRIIRDTTQRVSLPQHGTLWLVRVGLALVLVGWAVLSQVLGLAATPRSPATA